MLKITPKGMPGFFIRPTPLISIQYNPIRNKKGLLGGYYTITLTGTLLPAFGSPQYVDNNNTNASIAGDFYTSPNTKTRNIVDVDAALGSILTKQAKLRELLRFDGAQYEIYSVALAGNSSTPIPDIRSPILKFYPTVESIDFAEGIYVNRCDYTITLRAEVLYDSGDKVLGDSLPNSTYKNYQVGGSTSDHIVPSPSYQTGNMNFGIVQNRQTIQAVIDTIGGFIEDYSENWAIEVEEGRGITDTKAKEQVNPYDHSLEIASMRAYRLTRTVNVTGRTIYLPDNTRRYEAWEQARGYILKTVIGKDRDNIASNNSSGYDQFPELKTVASGLLNLDLNNTFAGYNHLRTLSIDETAGSASLIDTWILSSGTANEDYSMSLNRTYDSPIHKVSINGTIKGLTSVNAGSSQYGGSLAQSPSITNKNNTAYTNAVNKYHYISNDGKFGPKCHLYRRAQSLTHIPLNSVPLSIALSPNEFTGEIGYSIEYDSRPANLVSGTLQESVNCSDTYPGDVFAVIPVIGRATGPILQYIGGRTEYQRSLSIDLTFEQYWNSGTNPNQWVKVRQFGVLSKPSLNEPYRTQINDIITAYSPANEFGIRKYFVSPPQETWDVKSGKYTLNITWTYELSR